MTKQFVNNFFTCHEILKIDDFNQLRYCVLVWFLIRQQLLTLIFMIVDNRNSKVVVLFDDAMMQLKTAGYTGKHSSFSRKAVVFIFIFIMNKVLFAPVLFDTNLE